MNKKLDNETLLKAIDTLQNIVGMLKQQTEQKGCSQYFEKHEGTEDSPE